ncbi:CG0192 family protein [Corynebacterium mayonis]|uniref:CG0192 family protein n=1 Tax=Corynebacterium mayonis TaxID=3062461 RepID=UPI0031403336
MATAEIYDADLNPTKDEVAAKYSKITKVKGSYRAVDPDDVVGIEVLVGNDGDGNLCQLGLSYRPANRGLDTELLRMQHSELGERSVAYLTDDAVAVRELIRMIVTGDKGADYNNGEPIFLVKGNGKTPDTSVDNVLIDESNGWTSIGTVDIDGEPHRYQLRLTKRIHGQTCDDDELALEREDGATLVRLEVWR